MTAGRLCEQCRRPITPEQRVPHPHFRGHYLRTCRSCHTVCDACGDPIAPDQRVPHPRFKDCYLGVCEACLITQALTVLAGGSRQHHRTT
ncbi:hypothetical protein ACFVGM_09065 [Kitasatospora purpeofusca]|uniref:hypothetical protein n=1 Tax=Kitasatospora purpeofusca TaxID=67352 RepID=UPI00367526EB